jgi:prevent-host-death family protein
LKSGTTEVETTSMEKISVSKFKAKCPEVLHRVQQTRKPVMVTRYGTPLAEIVPPSGAKRRSIWLGALVGTGEILGDVVAPASDPEDWEVLGS